MRFVAINIFAACAAVAWLSTLPTAHSQTPSSVQSQSSPSSNQFVKKRYSIKGEWSIIKTDGQTQVLFSDDFKTKGGPDLKVFLSKSTIEDLESATASQEARSIGVLKSKSGGQLYTVPDDVEISEYKSIIIHCEAFSVLWGGFNLPHTTIAAP